MSNDSLRQSNNVKAGVFVILALTVGIVVVFLLGDLWNSFFGPSLVSYRTNFQMVDGVGYLQTGSEVRVGGIKVGSVDSVAFDESRVGPIERINVTFSIPGDIGLYSNSVATVQNGLISADSFIAISSVGFDSANRPESETGAAGVLLSPGDQFEGTGSGGLLGSLFGPKGAKNVGSILDRLDDETGMLRAIIGPEATDDVNGILADIDEISDQLKADGAVLNWVLGAPSASDVRQAIASIDAFVADFNARWKGSWATEVDLILANLNSTMAAVNKIIEDNRDEVDRIVARVDSVTKTAQETWSPQLTAIFASAKTSLADVERVVDDFKARAPLMLDNFGDALANLNVGSQQLNRAIAEISASPWRLLYRPTDKEYSNELLYEAARNFSFGAADLKSAAGSMQRLLEARGDHLAQDDRDFVLIRDNLVESFHRYERAQQQLMEILRGEGEPSADATPASGQ